VDWTRPIDAYCERLGPGLLAEPMNAATNAAFLVAAVMAFAEWRRGERRDWPSLALIFVVATIGIGSALFHTVANAWSALADVVPIAVFVHGYLLLALRRFLGLGLPGAAVAMLCFVALEALAGPALGPFIGGSSSYVPPLLALAATAGFLLRRGHPAAGRIGLATLVFAVSLSLRTADDAVCDALPLGTHFLWHVLNAVTLWLLTTAAVRSPPSRR
jgi:hypothetical protein